MNSYADRFAKYYDLIYADKPYKAEANFLHKCLQKYSTSPPHLLLELACGTGEHSNFLGEYGYEIIATDYSEDMLACARRKASDRESRVDFRVQDMRELNIPEAPFDAVFCLFDSIGYVETNEALEQVLEGVNSHLKPEGLFIFEFWHGAAMVRLFDPLRIHHSHTSDGELLRISETVLDVIRQLAEVTYTLYEFPKEGSYSKYREVHRNRFFLVQEMSAWLSRFRFKAVKWCAGFDTNKDIDSNTWHIVVVAQKI
jgi:SAM-dependent methyltransferase